MIRTCIYMPKKMHARLKYLCFLTNRSMGAVMRSGIREKIAAIKNENNLSFNDLE